MKLSEHFELDEFIVPGTEVPGPALIRLQKICTGILEPIRWRYGVPVIITSGYRTQEQNAHAGGVATSYHLFNDGQGAIDFRVEGVSLQGVFDWVRLESPLRFDKVILERKKGARGDEGACIHLQVSDTPRYLAYIGETHGTGTYLQVDSAGPSKGVTSA